MAVLSMRDYDSQKKIVFFNGVDEDCYLGDYVIQDTTYDAEGKPSDKQPHQVHLPGVVLKAGDALELHLTKDHKHGSFQEYSTYGVYKGRSNKKLLVVYAQFDRIINKTGDSLKLMHIVGELYCLPSDE